MASRWELDGRGSMARRREDHRRRRDALLADDDHRLLVAPARAEPGPLSLRPPGRPGGDCLPLRGGPGPPGGARLRVAAATPTPPRADPPVPPLFGPDRGLRVKAGGDGQDRLGEPRRAAGGRRARRGHARRGVPPGGRTLASRPGDRRRRRARSRRPRGTGLASARTSPEALIDEPLLLGTPLVAWAIRGKPRRHLAAPGARRPGRRRRRERLPHRLRGGPRRPRGPHRSASTPRRSSRRPVDDALDLHGRRVLVADDDPAIAWYFADLLRARGLRRRGGVRRRGRARPRPPHGPGPRHQRHPHARAWTAPRLCRALRVDPILGDVPVVLLSWKEDWLRRAEECGVEASAYLAKRSTPEEVRACVREVLAVARRGSSGACASRAPCADGSTARRRYRLLRLACATRPDARLTLQCHRACLRGPHPRRSPALGHARRPRRQHPARHAGASRRSSASVPGASPWTWSRPPSRPTSPAVFTSRWRHSSPARAAPRPDRPPSRAPRKHRLRPRLPLRRRRSCRCRRPCPRRRPALPSLRSFKPHRSFRRHRSSRRQLAPSPSRRGRSCRDPSSLRRGRPPRARSL